MPNLEWIKEIDNWKTKLPDQMLEIVEIIGEESFLKLWAYSLSTSFYFSEKPLNNIRIEYIKKYFSPGDAGRIARQLGVSQKFVFDHAPKSKRNDLQINMF